MMTVYEIRHIAQSTVDSLTLASPPVCQSVVCFQSFKFGSVTSGILLAYILAVICSTFQTDSRNS